VNPYPFDQSPEHDTDDVPRVVPYTGTSSDATATFTTVCSWNNGYIALDTQTRGIFIVATSQPEE